MAGVVVCFLISLSLFVTLGLAFEARERRAARLSAPNVAVRGHRR
jgi:hypothetical protein